MSYIDPKTLKIQLYSFVTSSYLSLHECILQLDIRVFLALTLHRLGLLFECGCIGHLTSRWGHPTGHCLDRGAVWSEEEGVEEGHREMRQTPRRPDWQWLEERLLGGHQGFSHESLHLGACSVGCLRPNFHSCKGSETKCRTLARGQACEDASSSDCKCDFSLLPSLGEWETPTLMRNLWHDQGKLGYQGRDTAMRTTASVRTRVVSTEPASERVSK